MDDIELPPLPRMTHYGGTAVVLSAAELRARDAEVARAALASAPATPAGEAKGRTNCTFPNCHGDQPDEEGECCKSPFTYAMADAAERYFQSMGPNAYPLPAQFRWSDCFRAMIDAAPAATQPTCKPGLPVATQQAGEDAWRPIEMAPKGEPVLLDIGKKYPIRAMLVEAKTLDASNCDDPDFGEYDEETDTYYWPAGWYEWNAHEECHWLVSGTPLQWHALPAPARAAQAGEAIPSAQPAPLDRSDAVNLARNLLEVRDCKGITERGVRVLCDAVMAMDQALTAAPAATQPAGEEAHPDIAKLRSAVNLALTYFGMDEDESNREVFKALREAYAHAASLPEHIDRIATVFGSLRKMSEALDIDVGYLSRLRSGEKADPSDEVLKALSLRKTVTYTKARTGPYEATPLIPRTRSA